MIARVLAVVILAVYWAGITLGGQFSIDPPGPLYDTWYSAARLVVGSVLAFAVGAYVARWAVLVVAVVPLAVLVGLELADHVAPWHDAGPPLSDWWDTRGWWPSFWAFVFPLALGVLVRTRALAPAPPVGPPRA